MIFCFDLDNTICKTNGLDYKNSEPYPNVIKKINSLYKKNKIIIFTARYMGRSNGDINLAMEMGYQSTKIQLEKWRLLYHELLFGKPVYDVFVDDKNFEFDEKWLDRFNKIY